MSNSAALQTGSGSDSAHGQENANGTSQAGDETRAAEQAQWRALSHMASAMRSEGLDVTLVVGGGTPPGEVIATDEAGGEARCMHSGAFDGFVGVITGDGKRHELVSL